MVTPPHIVGVAQGLCGRQRELAVENKVRVLLVVSRQDDLAFGRQLFLALVYERFLPPIIEPPAARDSQSDSQQRERDEQRAESEAQSRAHD
jgi:hypothetical protein